MRSRLVLLIAVVLLPSPVYGGPVGMILRVGGQAELIRASATQEALPGEILEEGDRLKVISGEALINFCPENARFKVEPGTSLVLGTKRIEKLEGGELTKVGTNSCSFPKVRLGEESLERVGALRPRGKPPIPVFVGGTVSTRHPRFSWRQVDSSDLYVVRLLDDIGATIWEQETAATVLQYPEDRRALEDGWYSWEVSAIQGGEVIAQQSTGFEVRTTQERPRPWNVDPDLLLPTAFAYETDGYYAEAASCLRRYLAAEGNDKRLRHRLAWLYWKAGLLPAFNEELGADAH